MSDDTRAIPAMLDRAGIEYRVPERETLAELLFEALDHNASSAWNNSWYIDRNSDLTCVRGDGVFDLLRAADMLIAAGWRRG